MTWVVHKFGGTSVKDASLQKHVFKIIHNFKAPKQAVVLSAMAGVTDELFSLLSKAKNQDETYLADLEKLIKRHQETLKELTNEQKSIEEFSQFISHQAYDLKNILRSISLAKTISETQEDLVTGHGELWSTKIFEIYLKSQGKSPVRIDARDVLIATYSPTGAVVDWEGSQKKLDSFLSQNKSDLLIITGFVASTEEGIPTTLKRNGSDYSAAIFAYLLNADAIHIWTDVDGVLSADPNRVPQAVLLNELSYIEALELAYFGAKVLHPKTMIPAMARDIPITIRNTHKPDLAGTKIHQCSDHEPKEHSIVKGIASIAEISLLNLEGAGMIGVPGISERLFRSLREENISVIMISQSSSEYSICLAIPKSEALKAKKVATSAFEREIELGHIQKIKTIDDLSILALVGEGMGQKPGVAAKFLSALSNANINVMAIAQGSCERNITLVVKQDQLNLALKAVHSSFYLSHQNLSVGLVGVGLIGKTLLQQVSDQLDFLKKEFHLNIQIKALANSKQMLLGEQLSLQNWESTPRQTLDLEVFTDHIKSHQTPYNVLIDCTASEDIPNHYAHWMQKGLHIITPNKKANSGDTKRLQKILKGRKSTHELKLIRRPIHYFYETTVGAGLPIISTLKDLIRSGDKITKIEGVFSGTLSYIFNTYDGKTPFSQIVKTAREQGLTEPDPREDLSGMDVTRKVIILAREIGLERTLTDIPTQNLVPEKLQKAPSIEDFLEGLKKYDDQMLDLYQQAQKQNQILRYVGVIDQDHTCKAKLESFPLDHPFANLQGSDNIISFTTKRYSHNPLVVQGPGAGAQVTAAGVFADLLRLADLLSGHN